MLDQHNTATYEGFHPLPQPDEIPIRQREDAMGSYLMMFASLAVGLPLPFFNIIASVVYYLLNKNKSRFVKFHTLQSLLSQIPVSILNAVVVSWGLYQYFMSITPDSGYWGFLGAVVIVNLVYIIFSIVAAVKARRGEMYYFIFFGRFCYTTIFQIRENDFDTERQEIKYNIPPKI